MAELAARLDMVSAVTAEQMREVDRVVVEDFGISLLQMMENAGRALAELTRSPREPEAGLIRAANSHGLPILALDLPSGLDPDRGVPHDPTIRATCTLALALPKVGLLRPEAASSVGELWLADISVPPQAYIRLGIDPGRLFGASDLLRITRS